jgi:ParB-like nuclease domain
LPDSHARQVARAVAATDPVPADAPVRVEAQSNGPANRRDRDRTAAVWEEASRLTPNAGLAVRLIARHAIDAPMADDPHTLRPLFESILRWGILQPLLVRPRQNRFELIAGRRRFAAASAAGLEHVPCIVCDVSDGEAVQLIEDLNEPRTRAIASAPSSTASTIPLATILDELRTNLSTISQSLTLAGNPSAGLRHQVARRLVDMELQRSSWIVDALAALGTRSEPAGAAPVPLGILLAAVRAAFESEFRLAGITSTSSVEPADITVHGYVRELTSAVSMVTGALLTLIQESGLPGPVVSLDARYRSGVPVISVSQNVLPPEACADQRRSQLETPSQPARARLGLQAARKLLESWGGRLELRAEGAGCAFDLKLTLVAR